MLDRWCGENGDEGDGREKTGSKHTSSLQDQAMQGQQECAVFVSLEMKTESTNRESVFLWERAQVLASRNWNCDRLALPKRGAPP